MFLLPYLGALDDPVSIAYNGMQRIYYSCVITGTAPECARTFFLFTTPSDGSCILSCVLSGFFIKGDLVR